MRPLRKQMQDAMVLRRFAARTQKSYIAAVVAIAKVYRRAGRADSGRSRALPAAADRRTQAAPAERKRWRLIGRGLGIHWEDLDEDISVEGLLAGKPSGESQASFSKWLAKRLSRLITRSPRTRAKSARAG